MDSILKRLQEPQNFDAFVNDYMKTSTYKALWRNEISQVDYCAARVYQQTLAEYQAAIAGSVIAKNGEKPVHQMPTIGELTGSIGHYGDQWELDADYLDQIDYLEGRLRNSNPNYTQAARQKDYDKLMTFAFRPFERATIAPHKRLDILYFEGLFNGTQTVNRVNNSRADISYTFNLEVKKFKAKVAKWGEAKSTPIDDIAAIQEVAESLGRDILRIRLSKSTFRKMCKSDQIAKTFKLSLGSVRVDQAVPLLSVGQVNSYLSGVELPELTIEPNRFVTLPDGSKLNMTLSDRVVFQCAPTVAVMKIGDPVELHHARNGKAYSNHDDNLVGYWEDSTGYHVDYDMWAQPVFNGINDYFILKTDEVEA